MNFYNQFIDSWYSRFPSDLKPPQMDFLKADQFSSVLEQKCALEDRSANLILSIINLKQKIDCEQFINDYILKCVQKLSAISQVFNEIDQGDSKSCVNSVSSRENCLNDLSGDSSLNGVVFSQSGKPCFATNNPNFSLLPQCIASSLINSASPLLAAVATSKSPFLFPSPITPFTCPDFVKSDSDNQLVQPVNSSIASGFFYDQRQMSDFFSYNSMTNHHHQQQQQQHNHSCMTTGTSTNVSSLTNSVSLIHSPPLVGETDSMNVAPDDHLSHTDAQAAAVAMAAAFGLNLSSMSNGTTKSSNNHNNNNNNNNIIKSGDMDETKQRNESGSSLLQMSPLSSLNGSGSKDCGGAGSGDGLTTERPFQCVTCSRSFAVKAGLVQHMRTHTDERPYPCAHCGRAFKQKVQLTTHTRVHSGERPYGCRLCGKLFRQQSHVVQHLRTHTGEKPHKCYQCGKAFRQKYSLISHQRRMCRNRTASNPITSGMTMWISPGVGGDTSNLVKEFSPTKTNASDRKSQFPASTPTLMRSPHTSPTISHSFNLSNHSGVFDDVFSGQTQVFTTNALTSGGALNGDSEAASQKVSCRTRSQRLLLSSDKFKSDQNECTYSTFTPVGGYNPMQSNNDDCCDEDEVDEDLDDLDEDDDDDHDRGEALEVDEQRRSTMDYEDPNESTGDGHSYYIRPAPRHFLSIYGSRNLSKSSPNNSGNNNGGCISGNNDTSGTNPTTNSNSNNSTNHNNVSKPRSLGLT